MIIRPESIQIKTVFLVKDDRRVYLQMLAEEAGKYGLEVLGYCLMGNHVHLVAIPHAE